MATPSAERGDGPHASSGLDKPDAAGAVAKALEHMPTAGHYQHLSATPPDPHMSGASGKETTPLGEAAFEGL